MTMDKLLYLAQSLDPLFPIGSYTLSNGMETYVQKGIVRDLDTLREFLDSYLTMLTYNELAFAAKAGEGEEPSKLDELYSALRAPSELRAGSSRQCVRFLKIHTELGNYPLLDGYQAMIKDGSCDGHHCIAMGLFIKDAGVELREGLRLYGYSILSTMVNQAVKLVPLRQLDGQRALYGILEKIPEAVEKAAAAQWDMLGAGGCGFDLRSMQHERLYSRLYSS